MLNTGILNPQILSLLARVRHTNALVIADRGFPFWPPTARAPMLRHRVRLVRLPRPGPRAGGAARMTVFIIPSWYPHRCFPWEGSFLVEQAQAALSRVDVRQLRESLQAVAAPRFPIAKPIVNALALIDKRAR